MTPSWSFDTALTDKVHIKRMKRTPALACECGTHRINQHFELNARAWSGRLPQKHETGSLIAVIHTWQRNYYSVPRTLTLKLERCFGKQTQVAFANCCFMKIRTTPMKFTSLHTVSSFFPKNCLSVHCFYRCSCPVSKSTHQHNSWQVWWIHFRSWPSWVDSMCWNSACGKRPRVMRTVSCRLSHTGHALRQPVANISMWHLLRTRFAQKDQTWRSCGSQGSGVSLTDSAVKWKGGGVLQHAVQLGPVARRRRRRHDPTKVNHLRGLNTRRIWILNSSLDAFQFQSSVSDHPHKPTRTLWATGKEVADHTSVGTALLCCERKSYILPLEGGGRHDNMERRHFPRREEKRAWMVVAGSARNQNTLTAEDNLSVCFVATSCSNTTRIIDLLCLYVMNVKIHSMLCKLTCTMSIHGTQPHYYTPISHFCPCQNIRPFNFTISGIWENMWVTTLIIKSPQRPFLLPKNF